MQLLVNIGAYSDAILSNVPGMQNFKWTRAINALSVQNPKSDALVVPISSTATVFTGSTAKRVVYLEADGPLDVSVNGGAVQTIIPLIQSGGNFPAMFLSTEAVTSISVTNNSTTTVVNVYCASAE